MTVYTIGYEGLDLDSFIDMLFQHGVEMIVDVRQLPLSRKKGFSKNSLASRLSFVGLKYLHLPKLGCPKKIRDEYRESRDWTQYTKSFKKYLNTQKEAVDQLSEIVELQNCALLCFEANPDFCHRSIVAEDVCRVNGAQIKHISFTVRTSGDRQVAYA